VNRTRSSDAGDARLPLEPGDARFVERLRDAFAPEPRDAPQRAAFEARLRERIQSAERPGSGLGGRWAAALAGSALALAALWLALGDARGGGAPAPEPVQVAAASRADQLAWEESLFFPAAPDAGREPEELPGEYQAIAGAFFGETL